MLVGCWWLTYKINPSPILHKYGRKISNAVKDYQITFPCFIIKERLQVARRGCGTQCECQWRSGQWMRCGCLCVWTQTRLFEHVTPRNAVRVTVPVSVTWSPRCLIRGSCLSFCRSCFRGYPGLQTCGSVFCCISLIQRHHLQTAN